MKAVVCKKLGSQWSLVYQDAPKPIIKEDEVLIQVKSTSINAADYRSMYLRMIPKTKIFGADVAGVIVEVGSKCKAFNIGDEVFGDLSNSGFGGLAAYAVAKEKAISIKPDDISFDVAAAIPMAGITALQGLRDAGKIQANQQVLVYGSGGGVGTFAVQLASFYEGHITTVCGPSNVDLMKKLGVEHVIDYQKDDINKRLKKYDLILAVNGSQKLRTYKKMLNKKGRLVIMGGALSQVLKALIFGPILSIGKKKIVLLKSSANQKDLSFLAELVQKEIITPVIDKKVTLEEVPLAFLELSKGHAKGKVVVQI